MWFHHLGHLGKLSYRLSNHARVSLPASSPGGGGRRGRGVLGVAFKFARANLQEGGDAMLSCATS